MARHGRLLLLFSAAWALAQPRAALAWGDDGHRIVGLIAQHYLDASVRSQVDALLAGDTTQLVSPLDIADEATWADKYRDSDRNGTKVRYDQTHLWHYVDLEIAGSDPGDLDTACNHHPGVPAGTPASAADPNDCVVDKIDQFAAELHGATTTIDERRMALQFLLHFVGDMHQPLHASDHGDQGGNAVVVHGSGVGATLHGTWDTQLVTSLGASDAAIAEALVAAITPELTAQWSQGTAADWAQEAYQLARTQAYGKLPSANADHSYTLDGAYVSNARQVVRLQLSRAGVRLAWVLQRALGAATPSPSPSPSPSPQELLGNPGFESGAASPWTATRGVLSDDAAEPARSGRWVAWLDGYGRAATDTLQQRVALPAGVRATLSFWLHIDSDETTRTRAYDTLAVQLLDPSGHVLKTLATYSNLDAGTGYRLQSFDIGAWAGRTVTVKFTGREDSAKTTSFVVDDASVTAP